MAPTVVGGSKKHGGPDLGPSRAKREWETLGVNGKLIGNAPPDENFPTNGLPALTVEMVARIQGFPSDWHFSGKKTGAYRQVGNAFPPPVARAVGIKIADCLKQPYLPKEIRTNKIPYENTAARDDCSPTLSGSSPTLSRELASIHTDR